MEVGLTKKNFPPTKLFARQISPKQFFSFIEAHIFKGGSFSTNSEECTLAINLFLLCELNCYAMGVLAR